MGAAKVIIGVVIAATGWTVGIALESQLIELLALVIGLALNLWAGGQVYYTRRSRGDIDFFGKRVKPVATLVNPPPASVPTQPLAIAGLGGWLQIVSLVLSIVQAIAREFEQQGKSPASVPEQEWRQQIAQALVRADHTPSAMRDREE
jgi:hypothetical protein